MNTHRLHALSAYLFQCTWNNVSPHPSLELSMQNTVNADCWFVLNGYSSVCSVVVIELGMSHLIGSMWLWCSICWLCVNPLQESPLSDSPGRGYAHVTVSASGY